LVDANEEGDKSQSKHYDPAGGMQPDQSVTIQVQILS
jgi:hypothetical protein